jgi:glyoxylate carboligase
VEGAAIMIDFRMAPHRVIAGKNVVEVMLDGKVVATIAATGIEGIQILSAHVTKHWLDDGQKVGLGTPSVHITFSAQPNSLGGS